ncbi:MAG: DUF1223 domain-containing protein [Rhodospirillales bacterium]|nr:DUF1223 domain-containing protein [Rhodospirillales bacterium]
MNILANYIQLFFIGAALFASLTSTSLATPNTPPNDPATPIIVEMFTSKYCPACPSADRNFNQLLNENPNIIALACHVSYFNRGSRGDNLARPFCDARQNVYKLALNTGGIYTPMTIINGQTVITGIEKTDLDGAIQQTGNKRNNETYHPVGLSRNGQYLDISLPHIALPSAAGADIWLFEVENIPKGEGYTHYRNAVKNITKLLRWDGRKLNMAFPAEQKPGISYALIVQTYKDGIIAATQTR